MEDIAALEYIVQAVSFQYDIDKIHGSMIGDLARRGIGKHSNSVRLLRYNSHIRFVSEFKLLFMAYRCTSCDQFIKRAASLERLFTTCKKKLNMFRQNVYQLQRTLFDKLDSFLFPYVKGWKFFKTLWMIDFKSFCVQGDKFFDMEPTTCIGKHIPVSVSISISLIEKPMFLCIWSPKIEFYAFSMLSKLQQHRA